MANTTIQIKRSNITASPSNGSLSAAEPAYSYASDKLFLGNTTGTGVIEVGGKYWVDQTVQAFNQANAAFDKANAANVLAFNTGIGANAYAREVGTAGNNYTITVGAASNNWANTVASASAVAANTLSATRTDAANGWANTISATRTNAANGWANTVASASAVGANNYADATFVKLIATSQTITGNLSVTGSLTISGNTFSIDTETLRVSDPLIYLAGNNYSSDIVDIGFVANYNNGSANLHTGLFRDATVKEYYLFQGYDKEPNPNHIDTAGNNFTLAVLNAAIRTSNLVLGGANAILTIGAANGWANTVASASAVAANTLSETRTNAANGWANTVASASAVAANTLSATRTDAANGWANTISATRTDAANGWANTVASASAVAANTNAANGSYISTGIVKVPYGGTGITSFTQNGILFGNTAGDLKVTAAGTEGQVLQASATGVPQFGMLDGGNF